MELISLARSVDRETHVAFLHRAAQIALRPRSVSSLGPLLGAIASGMSPRRAADAAGVGRSRAYLWRQVERSGRQRESLFSMTRHIGVRLMMSRGRSSGVELSLGV